MGWREVQTDLLGIIDRTLELCVIISLWEFFFVTGIKATAGLEQLYIVSQSGTTNVRGRIVPLVDMLHSRA